MAMECEATPLAGLLVIKPKVFEDARGFFFESFNHREFESATGVGLSFVQDNHSRSMRGVLRGLHYQVERPQGKLVRVVEGAVFDVAVDLRRRSATFGQWFGIKLSSDNRLQLWIPPGFAHGFIVTSPRADFLYKTTDYWAPQHERCLRWDDPDIGIQWSQGIVPTLSEKDRAGVALREAEVFGD
jgi:dTDP-4-dehydrorhamnose 3,5-epimerase